MSRTVIMRISELLPPKEYWKPKPPKTVGDQNPNMTWLEVGKSLSYWESVEEAFAMLFRMFVESKSRAAARAYGAIVSGPARRQALENAAEIFFQSHSMEKTDIEQFSRLMKHLAEAGTIRNEIAHGQVVSINPTVNSGNNFLVPPDYNSRKTSAFPKLPAEKPYEIFDFLRHDYRYTSEDIQLFGAQFKTFEAAAHQFFVDITEKYKIFP